jgi:hypothetical protein
MTFKAPKQFKYQSSCSSDLRLNTPGEKTTAAIGKETDEQGERVSELCGLVVTPHQKYLLVHHGKNAREQCPTSAADNAQTHELCCG